MAWNRKDGRSCYFRPTDFNWDHFDYPFLDGNFDANLGASETFNGFVDEEKLSGISKANLIYNPDLVADNAVNLNIQIFIEYQIETLINQPNYEQRYNSRNKINTERLRIVVEEPTSSEKFITFFNLNENTLYFLNYDD